MSGVILDVALRSDNDAFVDCPSYETARILRELADDIEASSMYCSGNLTDINGNRAGSFEFKVSKV
jgi:hypothetical protein